MIHFHRWSKWKRITIVGYTMGHEQKLAGQERVCLRCGKTQWEYL